MPKDASAIDHPGSPPNAAHACSIDAVVAALAGSAEFGLTEAEAERRLAGFGPNSLPAKPKASILLLVLHQFESPVVYLLSAAAGLALYFREVEQAAAIAIVLILNAAIGFVTEMRAARSIEALRSFGVQTARVRRGGRTMRIPAEKLVPGDLVLVDGGDAVPADLRVIDASGLGVDESALTGESLPVEKTVGAVEAAARLGDRSSMLYRGTTIVRGSGAGLVVATGADTELGRIAGLVAEAQAERSPLEERLARLSSQMVWVVLLLTVLIAVVGIATGKPAVLMVEAAIALAVAAIPEGLPIVATLALARGLWRMARQNALVERLSAVETLGATTVILTDKTGTLTENRMTVRRLWLPSGEIEIDGASAEPIRTEDPEILSILTVMALCNDATLGRVAGEDSGDPMELALLRAAARAGIERTALLRDAPLERKHAFDNATKMMATLHRDGDGHLTAVKGAPEAVLAAATRVIAGPSEMLLDAGMRAAWIDRLHDLGRHGLRVLACARRRDADPAMEPYADLTFLGLVGLEDPARADVPQAIATCHEAGIRVVMVTGDHAVTARSIGRAVGLAGSDGHVVVGTDLSDADGGPDRALADIRIFARVSPTEKLDLVRAYQAAGEVVAMTGDGVNDAPALRQADIGVAMGLRGTDVAREAGSMVLLDDAFSSIVFAIREGRVIFGNIRRFAAYLLSCNLGEVIVVGLAVLSASPLPILPLQILYLNLVTDVFPAFALALGDGERDVLKRPPRDPKEPILGRRQWTAIVLHGAALAAATLGAMAFAQALLQLGSEDVVTVTFLTLGFAQLWHVFDMRSARSSALRNEVTRNPWIWAALALCAALLAVPGYIPGLADILGLRPPDTAMWLTILAASLVPLVVVQGSLIMAGRMRSAADR